MKFYIDSAFKNTLENTKNSKQGFFSNVQKKDLISFNKDGITRENKNNKLRYQYNALDEAINEGKNKAIKISDVYSLTEGKYKEKGKDGKFKNKTGYVQRPSTAIQDVRYNPATQDFDVKFRKGKNKYYRFPDVPSDTVLDFMNHISRGKGYHEFIKPYSIA